MNREIYLDNHSTTPIDPEVLETMRSALGDDFGNAASVQHGFGRRAARRVEEARASVAALIHASPEEIVFTSGATESNNLALKGVARQYRGKGDHLAVSAVEHRSVLDSVKRLESEGFRSSVIGVLPDGRVRPEDVKKAVTDKTLIVSVMAANNEVGTLQPVAEIAAAAHAAGALFHTDATQAAGRVPLDVNALGADLLSLSAHKMYGPKGVGALYVRSKNPHVRLEPQMDGGGHEKDLRSGTLNVPGIAGFGKACEIARRVMAEESRRTAGLRDRLRDALLSQLDHAAVNGSMEHRLPNNLNISFAFVESESLLMRIGGVAVSSGAACASASTEPSHVLKALGVPDDRAHGSIRFGLGRFTTREEIDEAAKVFVSAVRELRDMSPLYRIAKEGGFAASVEWKEAK